MVRSETRCQNHPKHGFSIVLRRVLECFVIFNEMRRRVDPKMVRSGPGSQNHPKHSFQNVLRRVLECFVILQETTPKCSDLDPGAKTIRNIAFGVFYVVFWKAYYFQGNEEVGGSQNCRIWTQVPKPSDFDLSELSQNLFLCFYMCFLVFLCFFYALCNVFMLLCRKV